MYIKLAHILIEQGLQTIGVFAYADMLHEELDLQINKKMLSLLEDAFDPLKKSKHPYQDGQSILDKFQNIQVKNYNLSCTLQDDHYLASLPSDYVHLVGDASLVLKLDNMTPIVTGQIQVGSYYYVLGLKSIIYNGITYTNGQWFQGVTGLTGYTYTGTGSLLLVKLRNWKKANRVQYEEFVYQVLDNKLTSTRFNSPVSSLSQNSLWVYTDGTFFINNFYITYVRKPKLANYNFTTYDNSADLVVGQQYESVDNPAIYNGITYQKFQPFTIVTGVLNFSGFSTVRLYQDGDIELSDTMAYDVIDAVIADIAIVTEQPQQKVVNLVQKED